METKPKNNAIILLFIILGLVVTVLFGMRLMRSIRRVPFHHMPPPASTDVNEIHDWMPIPYIAKIYSVPEPYLYEQAGIPRSADRKDSLLQLNEKYFSDQPGIVLEKVKTAVQEFQASHPVPPAPPDAPPPSKP